MRCDAPITIDNVFPWGRTLDEYRRMFDLSDADVLDNRILAVADGPASFNAEVTALGGRVLSCDPLYRFGAEEIRNRVRAARGVLVELARRNSHRFVWDRIPSPEALGDARTAAMELFLADYERGRREGRYADRALPKLGLDGEQFDLAVCSHFLFLYSDEFPLAFHVNAILELTALSPDVRIFPLLDMAGQRSAHVSPVIDELTRRGLHAVMRRVDYEFQRGGNEMLRVTREAR